jgi:L-cysteine/cystine lyase
MTIEEARALFPVLEHTAYLNAGTFGPLARPTVEAMQGEQARDLFEGRVGKAWFERALVLRAELRGRLAALVSAEAEQVALTASTTDGCNIVVAGLGLGPDDEVVTTTDEHFGLLGPLHASGARVILASPDPDAVLAAVTPRTRLLALSEVTWTTGRRLPLRELRERSGIPVLADCAQSVGAVEVYATGVDFLAFSGQKWLCGPDATGVLVVADPDRLRIARPGFFSQTAHERDGSFTPRPGGARFEPNWQPVGTVVGLLAAIDLAPEWRYEHAAVMTARCRELLEPVVPLEPGDATLVAFRADEPEAVVTHLTERGVVVREIPGRGLVRASVGWWTSEDDLRRFAFALAEYGVAS